MSTLPQLLSQRRVFVDSSAYLALLDQSDVHHTEAITTVERLGQHRFRQFTTNNILIETHALLLSSLGITPAAVFLRAMPASNTVIVRTRLMDEENAKQIIFTYTDKEFSFTDAISFSVMERLNIRRAFTFDRHFQQYGFIVSAQKWWDTIRFGRHRRGPNEAQGGRG